jgi:hypothetical protein
MSSQPKPIGSSLDRVAIPGATPIAAADAA